MRRTRSHMGPVRIGAVALLFSGLFLFCGDPEEVPPTDDPAPVLTPEPAGAPAAVADGRLTCLGNNSPGSFSGNQIQLLAWIRTFADPDNDGDLQPAARGEAFDSNNISIGTSFSDTGGGRLELTVPATSAGFDGRVVVTADGYLDWHFYSSRAYVPVGDALTSWAWLITAAELQTAAEGIGSSVQAGTGVLVGAVHDCDGFGIANVVVRWGGSTDNVVYLDDPAYKDSQSGVGSMHFAPGANATFTDESGRFTILNVNPGAVTVEAFGRTAAGGSLVLLSLADVTVVADAVVAVDMQLRVGVQR